MNAIKKEGERNRETVGERKETYKKEAIERQGRENKGKKERKEKGLKKTKKERNMKRRIIQSEKKMIRKKEKHKQTNKDGKLIALQYRQRIVFLQCVYPCRTGGVPGGTACCIETF